MGDYKGNFIECQCGNGKKWPSQSKSWPGNQHGHQRCKQGSGDHGQPWRQVEGYVKFGRPVSADAKEHTMAQGELTTKTANDVPCSGQPTHQIGECDDV